MSSIPKAALVLTICIVMPFIACQNNTKKQQDNNLNEEITPTDSTCLLVEKLPDSLRNPILQFIETEKKRIENSGGGTYLTSEYTEENIEAAFPVFSYWLSKKNYNGIAQSDFLNKAESIFNINLKNNCNKIKKHENYFVYIIEEDFYPPTPSYIFFSTKYNFIFQTFNDCYFIDIVDPNNVDEHINKFKICFPENLYHYNNYLFHNSQTSLTWLINNDYKFLEILVKEFGYVKDKRLLKCVLEKNPFHEDYYTTNMEDYFRIITNRRCNGGLVLNTELLEIMKEDKKTYSHQLYDFVTSATWTLEKEAPIINALSFEEKAYVLAHVLYWAQTDFYGSPDPMKHFYLNYPEIEKIEAEWEKNNYYGLPNYALHWNSAIPDEEYGREMEEMRKLK